MRGLVVCRVSDEKEKALDHDHRLDARGTLCPIPVIKAKKMLTKMAQGQSLLVDTTDPVAQIDIPHMCKQFGYTLVLTAEVASGHCFLIRK